MCPPTSVSDFFGAAAIRSEGAPDLADQLLPVKVVPALDPVAEAQRLSLAWALRVLSARPGRSIDTRVGGDHIDAIVR